MKAIIYAGIGLFSVASIYGVVDYYNTQKKGTLKNLYKEPEEVVVTETPVVKTTQLSTNVNNANVMNTAAVSKATKKVRHQKRTIRLEEFSRGRIEEPVVIESKFIAPPVEASKKIEIVPEADVKTETIAQTAVIKKELPRKISLDQFSRAPLRTPVLIVSKQFAKKN